MKPRQFLLTDLSTINAWRAGHGLPGVSRADLPKTGFIVDGAAAGFLVRTESKTLALLDSFVSCPTAPLRARHAAVKELTHALTAEAQSQGIETLGALTQSSGIVKVGALLGFRSGGVFQAIGKSIRREVN